MDRRLLTHPRTLLYQFIEPTNTLVIAFRYSVEYHITISYMMLYYNYVPTCEITQKIPQEHFAIFAGTNSSGRSVLKKSLNGSEHGGICRASQDQRIMCLFSALLWSIFPQTVCHTEGFLR